MKKIYLFTLLLFSLGATAQQTFYGNGKNGFGGTMGIGSLQISNPSSGHTINFIFSRGTDLLDHTVVIYIDSKPGGFSSTAGFQDNAGPLRKAVSGFQSSTEKSILTFPSGFFPDYAIAFDQNTSALIQLANGGANSLGYISGIGLSPSGSNSSLAYSFSVDASQLNIPGPTAIFSFLANYVSTTAFRANEFIGDGGPVGNPGYGDYTATSYNIYSGGVLPLVFTNVQARYENQRVRVSWTSLQEQDVAYYEIYRSVNNNQFGKIGSVIAKGNALEANYSFEDLQPAKGRNLYQVHSVDRDGRKLATNIVSVNSGSGSTELTIYTNPGTSDLKLKMTNVEKGDYMFRVFNNAGQMVFQYKFFHQGIDNTASFSLPPSLNKGIYRVSLAGNRESFTQSFYLR